jgi:mannose-6-phosphate isomerase
MFYNTSAAYDKQPPYKKGTPMISLYPLRFRLLVRRYLWGSRRLETCLGKPIGPGNDYAESWEVSDHGADQSIIDQGPLAGITLGELVHQRGPELFGRHHPQPRFPLLIKFLDAARALSVQVHPNDDQAARMNPPDLGKTEAWYILSADPGSAIYAGLRPGVDHRQLADAIRQGTCENLLHQFHPKAGDCLFIPAGTVHALGAGLLVAEVQQSSDTTFRLYDWNRVGSDGKPRPLHVEQGLDVVDFRRGPVDPVQPQPADHPWVNRLVACDKFIMDRWDFDHPTAIGGDNRFHVVCVLQGAVQIAGDPQCTPLPKGGTVLLPACIGGVRLVPQERTVLLDAYLG